MHCLPIKTLLLALLLMALAEDISASKSKTCKSHNGYCMKAKKCKKTIEPMYTCPHKKHICCVEDHTTSAPAGTSTPFPTTKGDNMETKLDTMMDLIKKLAGYMEMKLDNMEDKLDTKMDHIIELLGYCTFNGEKYESGYNHVVGCAELYCKRDGDWEYKGIIEDCGNCTVGGEPWVYPFDHPWTPSYTTSADGEYVLTQLGLHTIPSSAYGVHGHFVGGSYVKGATYHENIGDWIYVFCNAGIPTAPCSSLEVMGSVSGTITSFPNKQGNIWVFESVDCIIIVGVKLTVVMCPKVPGAPQPNDPYVYIYAPQSLRSWPSALYGLCKRYTNDPTTDYMASNGTIYPTPDGPFIESWIHQNIYVQN